MPCADFLLHQARGPEPNRFNIQRPRVSVPACAVPCILGRMRKIGARSATHVGLAETLEVHQNATGRTTQTSRGSHGFTPCCINPADCIESHTKSSRARRGFLRGIWGNETREPRGGLGGGGRGEGIDSTRGAGVPVSLGCRGLAQTPRDSHSPQAVPRPPQSAPNCTHAAPVLNAARPRTWAGFRPVWDCTFCDTESTRARRGDKRVKWGLRVHRFASPQEESWSRGGQVFIPPRIRYPD